MLLLAGEWASVPLSRYVIFSIKEEVVLSSPNGHYWIKQCLSLALVSFSSRRSSYFLSVVSGNWYTFDFFSFYFMNLHRYCLSHRIEKKIPFDIIGGILFPNDRWFLYNINNYLISINYFYLIIVIFLYTGICCFFIVC